MDGMLAFLLFVGALGLDLGALRSRAGPVVTVASAGTAVSAAVIGLELWASIQAISRPLSLVWALVFGALVIAAAAVPVVLGAASLPFVLQCSCFHDGCCEKLVIFTATYIVVLFSIIVQGSPLRLVARHTLLREREKAEEA
jgi:CPA1 family monovalent cation:H+ antiporter